MLIQVRERVCLRVGVLLDHVLPATFELGLAASRAKDFEAFQEFVRGCPAAALFHQVLLPECVRGGAAQARQVKASDAVSCGDPVVSTVLHRPSLTDQARRMCT